MSKDLIQMNEFHSNLKTEKLPGQEKLRVDITLEEKARTKKEERERERDWQEQKGKKKPGSYFTNGSEFKNNVDMLNEWVRERKRKGDKNTFIIKWNEKKDRNNNREQERKIREDGGEENTEQEKQEGSSHGTEKQAEIKTEQNTQQTDGRVFASSALRLSMTLSSKLRELIENICISLTAIAEA